MKKILIFLLSITENFLNGRKDEATYEIQL